MTEFLKNNPIALLHCVLYEFFQGKPIKIAFSDFCDVVGDDVIEKEEFQFWFNQFKQGKFNDDNEAVDNLENILRNDKKALRVCVLYEWLDTKRKRLMEMKKSIYYKNSGLPVFAKYKNFCKVIGDNVMEYREFDFWFYRFFNGEFETNFERDAGGKIHELTDIPIVCMENIVKYLNIFDRLALARTSRSFKTFIENQRLFHHKLNLKISDDVAYVDFGIKGREILYEKRRKSIHWVRHRKQAIQGFKTVLKNPKLHLKTLKIVFDTKRTSVMTKMFDELVSTHQIHVENLYIGANSTDPLLKILPSITPGYLTTIEISAQKMDSSVMNKVVELEQWKQAERFSMRGRPFVPMRHLYHFKEFIGINYPLRIFAR